MNELVKKDFESEEELIQSVWRYLTFSKFVSLLELKALWFSKLETLIDRFEGTLPNRTRKQMIQGHLEFEHLFPDPELKSQLHGMTDRNVDDGRELSVVNCWFMGGSESEEMWRQYVGTREGIVIKSTVKRLSESIYLQQEFSRIGRVKYVDFLEHDMGVYEGHQAAERALLKQKEYEFENEVRIVTMSLVAPGCLNIDGTKPTEKQLSGPGMFDPDSPGIYVQVDLNLLIEGIHTAPGAPFWFHNLVQRLSERYGLTCPVNRSSLN